MNSNGDARVKSPTAENGRREVRPADRPASSAASPPAKRKTSPAALQNGANSDDDAPNESEAETVVLDHKQDRSETKVIKTERCDDDDDDDDNHARLRSVKEAVNGRNNSRHHDRDRPNGARHGDDADAKSPVSASPSSRTTSRHTKETSPTDSARSPVHSTTSPPQPTGRGRSVSAAESRKRKLRDDSHPKALEPPRQKVKTEGARDMRQPTSPATPGVGRPHKRSQSTQSFISGATGRKRKDVTSLAVSTERKNWSDDSSENSSSPRPAQTPNPSTMSRSRRPGRALTSPARAMAPRRVDRFGSTRLARESEKGNLNAVKSAYEAAPDEIDVPDFAGITPLQKASLHGWDEVVEFLISKGCRTDCESNDRDTPLIDAVENGHLDVVKLLLNKGHVNPHHQNKKGQRAIDVLPSKSEVEDVDEIEKELRTAMRREVDTSANDEDSNAGATQSKSTSRLLYNEYNTETLIEKAGDGDMLAVGELINSNVKINIQCGVAASRAGHYDILSILLASGLKPDPDPSKHSETPMSVAIGRGHLKIVNLLLEQDNFNPTRRNREGKTYWEISEERRGPKWEQERDTLKQAYLTYMSTRKSPKRVKKEQPNPAGRTKRKSSPLARRERSSSPRSETKRILLAKSTTVPQAQLKSRRLMSGKEMANREVKRQRRVVDDETSDDEEEDSDDEVRAPVKKSTKLRSYSDGEEPKTVKKRVKGVEHETSKRIARAASHDRDGENERPKSKIRNKMEKENIHVKTKAEPDSADEKKIKPKIKSRPADIQNIKKRRASNDSLDDTKTKRTVSGSAKSTPAPPEKASTPDVVRERRLEEHKAAEAKKKAAEEATRKREEEAARKREEEAARKREEEAARKREEEEAARKAAEEEARKKAQAEAEAKRAAEEAEAARKREEEEAKRRAEEEAKRQEELAARQRRVETLPRALRRACEMGNNRPLHFSGEELGISAVFLPLFYTTSADLQLEPSDKTYIPSFQAIGILGLPELDLARLPAPYSTWPRFPFTPKHRDHLLRQYDVALLAQDFRFPMEGTPDFNYAQIQDSIKEARQQFLDMEGLYWIEDSALYPEVESVGNLKPLVDEIKDISKRRRVHLVEADASGEAVKEKKHRPRKSFMDMVLAKQEVNGVALKINGDA